MLMQVKSIAKYLNSNLKQQLHILNSQAKMMKRYKLPERLQGSKPTVWHEYTELHRKYKPLNIGHGFPDEAPPSYITEALSAAAMSDDPLAQQYTRGYGHLRLVQAIAKLFSCLNNRSIDPQNEVLVTVGAYEALFSSIMGHVDKGDEVILIEPFFDCYLPMVKMAGGTPRFIPLRLKNTTGTLTSADFCLEDKELQALFNERTKMIILNSPHNPFGKVFRREELEKIAELCRKWDVICVSDEVYEWLVYDGNEHIRICTLPDMWERTITIGSAGKTFSVTGWKTGWAYGPTDLLKNLRMIHQNCVDTCPRPIQEALAICFEKEICALNTPESYFKTLAQELQVKRDYMANFLKEIGMRPIVPQGAYFMLTDWSPLANAIDLSSENDSCADYRFTKWMIKNLGIMAVPPSAFYSNNNKHIGEKYVRFCFIKKQQNLEKAAELFKNWIH